jgi:hypothetical protein
VEHASDDLARRTDPVGELLLRDRRDDLRAAVPICGLEELANHPLTQRREGAFRHLVDGDLGHAAQVPQDRDGHAGVALSFEAPSLWRELVDDRVR